MHPVGVESKKEIGAWKMHVSMVVKSLCAISIAAGARSKDLLSIHIWNSLLQVICTQE